MHGVSHLTLPPLVPPEHPGAGQGGRATNSAPAAAVSATNRPISTVIVAGAAPTDAPGQPIEGLPAPSGPGGPGSAATLGIDPRVLLEYLAPVGTNGAPRTPIPVRQGFVPPIASPPAPRSSQATYESR
jgi:hypothetical protein